MSGIETPRFPDLIAAGTKFGPEFSTAVARNFGGYRFANQNWALPLHRGDVMHAAKEADAMEDLLAFIYATAGMFNPFRFKHYGNYAATTAEGILDPLTATTWQLYKRHSYGALQTDIKIIKPVAGAVTFSGGGTYSLDTTTGIVTVTSGADPTAWSGEFDFWVAFDVDTFEPANITQSIYRLDALPIVEVRL